MKVYALPHDFPDLNQERALIKSIGAELIEIESTDTETIAKSAVDGEALFVQYTQVGVDIIQRLRRCKIILRYGIGYDNVDLEAAGKQGIYVCNVPHYCGSEVADHTMSLILALARKLIGLNHVVHQGGWEFLSDRPIHCLADKVLGLVGCGFIAQKVAKRAQAFDMEIIAYDPWLDPKRAETLGIKLVELADIWGNADYISLHVPLNPQTKHIICESSLSRMKPGAIIVNTARGGLVNAFDVHRYLDMGKLGGVGLDVLEQEPPGAEHPLFGCNNVLFTPHSAYFSEQSLSRLQRMAAEEVVLVLRGERPLSPVNLQWMEGRESE